jgi:hypothetical protein
MSATEKSWAERMLRHTLGTATCGKCGAVHFHAIPGPFVPVRNSADGVAVRDVSLLSHTCDRLVYNGDKTEVCNSRLECGYSCGHRER